MPSIPPQIQQIITAGRTRAARALTSFTQPPPTPAQSYTRRMRVTIPNGIATGVVAGGTVTLAVGPMGLGSVWYPQSAAITTTTGVTDSSTCLFYVGQIAALGLPVAQSYQGGGDSVGLPVPPVWPGTYVVAVWSGAHDGDTATLTVYGQQDVLVNG